MTTLLESPSSAKAVEDQPRDAVFDASTWLIVYLVLLIGIPATLTIHALGAAGSPANLFGIAIFFRWVVARLQGQLPAGRNVLRWALAVLALAYLLSGVAAGRRPLGPLEQNGLERGLLTLLEWLGVALAAMDGLRTRAQLERILKVAVGGGIFMAVIGLIQYATPYNPVDYIQIPGLSANDPGLLGFLGERQGLTRVAATTSHPIEFAVVMVMMIGLAIPFALKALPLKQKRVWIIGIGLMLAAFPLGVARSGFIAFIMLVVWIVPTWPGRWQRRTLYLTPFALLAGKALLPGVGGTIVGLFVAQASGTESSSDARTADYPSVWQYFTHRPFFGQGVGTYLPVLYRTLDNQLLGTLMETGIVGLFAYVGLFTVAIRTARRARKKLSDRDDRLLGQCLSGAILAGLVSTATFDSFSFAIFSGIMFLTVGLCGAYANAMSTTPIVSQREAGTARKRLPSSGRWRAVLIEVIIIGGFWSWVQTAPPIWHSVTTVLVDQPQSLESRYHASIQTGDLSGLLEDELRSDQVQSRLAAAAPGASYTVARGTGSTEAGTDQDGSGPELTISVQSSNESQIQRAMYTLTSSLTSNLNELQNEVNIDPSVRATLTTVSSYPSPLVEFRRPKIAYGLLILIAIVFWAPLRRLTARRRRPVRTS